LALALALALDLGAGIFFVRILVGVAAAAGLVEDALTHGYEELDADDEGGSGVAIADAGADELESLEDEHF
jgi:hypothetical protein